MKLLHALLPACALLLPVVVCAQTFEGKVTMKMSSPSMKDGSQVMDMSIKEGYMRMDMNSQRGSVAMITDFKNQQILIIMAAQHMYMVRPIPQPGSAQVAQAQQQASGATLQDTGTTETILGYTCKKYVVTGKEGTSEIWVTDQLGTFGGLFHGGGPGQRSQAPASWEAALQGKAFFPLRVVTTSNGGKTFTLEVTAIDKEILSDSLFAAPEGYQKFDLGALMGGFGRPPGGN